LRMPSLSRVSRVSGSSAVTVPEPMSSTGSTHAVLAASHCSSQDWSKSRRPIPTARIGDQEVGSKYAGMAVRAYRRGRTRGGQQSSAADNGIGRRTTPVEGETMPLDLKIGRAHV